MSGVKRTIRVLHLASFAGNIGDLANHAGARRKMAEKLSVSLEITELEIREFYWKQRHFDDDFVSYANGFDLLIVGGGNYFELWVDHSATGTSIDLTPERLARLTVPTVFFALGVDTGQGYSERSAQRFSALVDTILGRSDLFFCVRNDGSSRALAEVLGDAVARQVPVMPDCGFFAGVTSEAKLPGEPKRLGINLAGDMLERRFDRSLSVEGFLKELAGACTTLLDHDPSLKIDLMPHIWRDILFISQLLPMIPDPYLRRRISIGRMETTAAGLPAFLSDYRGFDLVWGMRFHANVCPLGMGVPSRGLLNYPQVQYLYDEIGMSERVVDVREPGFGQGLVAQTQSDFAQLPAVREGCTQLAHRLNDQADTTFNAIDAWLMQNLK